MSIIGPSMNNGIKQYLFDLAGLSGTVAIGKKGRSEVVIEGMPFKEVKDAFPKDVEKISAELVKTAKNTPAEKDKVKDILYAMGLKAEMRQMDINSKSAYNEAQDLLRRGSIPTSGGKLRAIAKRMGYELEEGGEHLKVKYKNGDPVLSSNGMYVTIPRSPEIKTCTAENILKDLGRNYALNQ